MNVNMSLSDDKQKLQVTIMLPERTLVTDEILTRSRTDVISMVEDKYPEFVFVSGPRKVSNRVNGKLTATWAFEMKVKTPVQKEQRTTSPTQQQSKKTTSRRKKTTASSNKP